MTRARAKGVARPAGLCSLSLAAHVSLRQEAQQLTPPELLSPLVSVVGGCVCRFGARALLRSTAGVEHPGMAGAEAGVGCDGAGR